MKKPFCACILLVVSITVACAAGPNVLWLGNSLTAYEDMPVAVADLAATAGLAAPYHKTQIEWGQSLQRHYDKIVADGASGVLYTGLPAGQKWDFFILQEYGQDMAAGYPQNTIDDALALANLLLAHSPDATIVMYERWATGHRNYTAQVTDQDKADASNAGAVAAINSLYGAGTARLANVGGGFKALKYDTCLYSGIQGNGDWLHPGCRGSLLAAMIHYGILYNDPTLRDLDFAAFSALPWMGLKNWPGSTTSGLHRENINEPTWARLAAAAELILAQAGVARSWPSDASAAWAAGIAWLQPQDADAAADPDRDNAGNFLEYLRGSNPLAPDAVASWQGTAVEDGQFVVEVSPVRRDAGLAVSVEASRDLAGWGAPPAAAETTITAIAGNPGFDAVRVATPVEELAADPLFVRLRAAAAVLPPGDLAAASSPCTPPSGGAYVTQLAGFDPIAPVASAASVSGAKWTLNAGNCCGTPYASSTADILYLAGGPWAWASAFSNAQLPVTGPWRARFTMDALVEPNNVYIAFVVHNDPRGAKALNTTLSSGDRNGAEITPAYSVSFFANADGYIGFSQNGKTPAIQGVTYQNTGLTFGSPVDVTIAYDGATLSVCIDNGTRTHGASRTVDLAAAAGGSTARVGFSIGGASGNNGFVISGFSFATAP